MSLDIPIYNLNHVDDASTDSILDTGWILSDEQIAEIEQEGNGDTNWSEPDNGADDDDVLESNNDVQWERGSKNSSCLASAWALQSGSILVRHSEALSAMMRVVPPALSSDHDSRRRLAAVCELAVAYDLNSPSDVTQIRLYEDKYQVATIWTDAEIEEGLRNAEKSGKRGSALLPDELVIKIDPPDHRNLSVVTLSMAGQELERRVDVLNSEQRNSFCNEALHRFRLSAGALDLLEDRLRDAVRTTKNAEKPNLADALPVSKFVQQDCSIEYLIPQILVANQPGVISARSKSLKTTIALDANVSMATGTSFLNHWPVERPVRCGILAAESGAATVKETLLRISRSKGLQAGQIDNCFVSTKCPQLRSQAWLDEIRRFIDDRELRCLTIDPTYLAIAGAEQNNLASMAESLAPLNRIIEATSCTIVMVHHNRKVTTDRYSCPTLEEIVGSGFSEWARFWLLLCKRREWDPDTSEHWLWLATGGSAGHGAASWLHVCEREFACAKERIWRVEVEAASDGIERERDERQRKRDQNTSDQLEADKSAIRQALATLPSAATKTELRDLAHLNTIRVTRALEKLLASGEVECRKTDRKANGRVFDGYVLSGQHVLKTR